MYFVGFQPTNLTSTNMSYLGSQLWCKWNYCCEQSPERQGTWPGCFGGPGMGRSQGGEKDSLRGVSSWQGGNRSEGLRAASGSGGKGSSVCLGAVWWTYIRVCLGLCGLPIFHPLRLGLGRGHRPQVRPGESQNSYESQKQPGNF